MTEEQYWSLFHRIHRDVEAAIGSNQAYLTIHNLSVAEPQIQNKINRFPEFWTLNTFALQTAFFIAFGRLFDKRKHVCSVHTLVDATIANPLFFSKIALLARKRAATNIHEPDPAWLADYVQNAWEPTAADLRTLKVALDPHWKKFKITDWPIRNKFFAHRSTDSDATISALFGKTLISDVTEILCFLHTLIHAISGLASNATKPDLSDFTDYYAYVSNVKSKTEKFIRQLP